MVCGYLRIQALMDIVNTVRHCTNSALTACQDTRFSFFLTLASVFCLNLVIASCAKFLFNEDPVMIYGSQLLGYCLSAAGGCYRWWERSNYFVRNAARLFGVNSHIEELPDEMTETVPTCAIATESPRNPEGCFSLEMAHNMPK